MTISVSDGRMENAGNGLTHIFQNENITNPSVDIHGHSAAVDIFSRMERLYNGPGLSCLDSLMTTCIITSIGLSRFLLQTV